MSSKEAAEAETFRVDELKNHYPSSFTIQQISNSVTVRECMPWTMILINLEDNQIQICHRNVAGIWFPQKPFLTIWLLSRESVFRASSSATCFSWLPGILQDPPPVPPPSFLPWLSDPGKPGVRSLGPDVRPSVTNYKTLCRLNWCDSGWWGYQLNTNW